jgi:hypothetical protein
MVHKQENSQNRAIKKEKILCRKKDERLWEKIFSHSLNWCDKIDHGKNLI